MRQEYFAAMSDAYVMTAAEQRTLRNKMLALRRHHVRCIHQLQWHLRHGLSADDPQFRKIEKRIRSLEKRIGAAQHRLAHAHIYEDLTQPQVTPGWRDIRLVCRLFWRRLRQKRHTV
ncbi:MAG TPA: hypothetical protein VD735_05290 [Candidatus Saccharimonadales bacterium]|nr:hypothetical protein [Candidatus Saccharimonadales bacterium]